MTSRRQLLTGAVLLCVFAIGVSGVPIVAANSAAVGVVDVTVSPEQPVPNEPTTYYVTIENNANDVYEIDSLKIERESPFDDPEQVWDVAVVPPGGSIEVPVSIRFDDKGLHRTQVVVEGSVNGTTENRQYPVPVTVRDGGPDISLSSENPTVGSGESLTVRAVNGEDRSIRNINVSVEGDDVGFETTNKLATGMSGNEQREFKFRYIPQSAGETELNATFQYTTSSGYEQTITKSTTVDVSARSAQESVDPTLGSATIQLTGIEMESEDDHMRITGSASNLGTDDIESVLVRVVETETVEPTNPNRDFFIGTVPGSDFGTFDLTAEIGGNTTRVPVEVSYISDGNRITERTVIEVPATTGDTPDTSGDTSLAVYLIGGVIVVGVFGVMGVAVYNSRKDDGGD